MQLSRDPGDELLFIPRITLESDKVPRMQIPETAIMPMALVPPSRLQRKESSFQGGTATNRRVLRKLQVTDAETGKSLSVRGRCATSSIYPRGPYLQFPGSSDGFPRTARR